MSRIVLLFLYLLLATLSRVTPATAQASEYTPTTDSLFLVDSQELGLTLVQQALINDAPTFDVPFYVFGTSKFFEEGTMINGDSCLWDFGDGTPSVVGDAVSHFYLSPGEYTLKTEIRNSALDVKETFLFDVLVLSLEESFDYLQFLLRLNKFNNIDGDLQNRILYAEDADENVEQPPKNPSTKVIRFATKDVKFYRRLLRYLDDTDFGDPPEDDNSFLGMATRRMMSGPLSRDVDSAVGHVRSAQEAVDSTERGRFLDRARRTLLRLSHRIRSGEIYFPYTMAWEKDLSFFETNRRRRRELQGVESVGEAMEMGGMAFDAAGQAASVAKAIGSLLLESDESILIFPSLPSGVYSFDVPVIIKKVQPGTEISIKTSSTVVILNNCGTVIVRGNSHRITIDENSGTVVVNENDDTITINKNTAGGTVTVNDNDDTVEVASNGQGGTVEVKGNDDTVKVGQNNGNVNVDDNNDTVEVKGNNKGTVTVKGNREGVFDDADVRVKGGGDVKVDGNDGNVSTSGGADVDVEDNFGSGEVYQNGKKTHEDGMAVQP